MLLDDMATLLQSLALGAVAVGQVPDGVGVPDALTAVLEYAGSAPLDVMGALPGATTVLEYPRVQFVIRGPRDDYQAARAQAEVVYRAVHWTGPVTLNGIKYHLIRALQLPFPLKRDANNRMWVVFNAEVCKAPSS